MLSHKHCIFWIKGLPQLRQLVVGFLLLWHRFDCMSGHNEICGSQNGMGWFPPGTLFLLPVLILATAPHSLIILSSDIIKSTY
jgi:hypothetical protein